MAQETGQILAQTQVASIICLTKILLLLSYLPLPFISGISPDGISHFCDEITCSFSSENTLTRMLSGSASIA